ncbi:hypothetical protein [Pikeienuella sp. HZG-20]|uniref:hypothetical protein n=1 Tax=Paludibacillus litoralis TaxID=3133267 RepID=UPI0030ED5169
MFQVADGAPAEIKVIETAGDPIDVLIPLTSADGADIDLSGWAALAAAIGRRGGSAVALDASLVGSAVRLQASRAITGALDQFSDYSIRLTRSGEDAGLTIINGVIQILPKVSPPGQGGAD